MSDRDTTPKVRGAPLHRAAGDTIAPGHSRFDQPRLGRVDCRVAADTGSGLHPVVLGHLNATECRESDAQVARRREAHLRTPA